MNPFTPVRAPAESSLRRCAEQADELLRRRNLALTMGGEPTFIPLHPEGPEWHTAALGPEKLPYAQKMAHALIRTFCPGGIPLFTYGKRYPGEPIPRWTLRIIWDVRPDHAFWTKPRLLAKALTNAKATTKLEKIATATATALGLADYLIPFHEEGEDSVTAYALPLDQVEGKWISDRWFGRARIPALVPGDSLAGLRLPLFQVPEDKLKRAMVFQMIDQQVIFFIPPLWENSFRELIHLLEDLVAREKPGPVQLAGYPPEGCGPMVQEIGLASDPGVLEVNLAPCRDWNAYARQLEALYRAAGQVGLVARKLHYNGTVAGTGGGAHLCFGGATQETSPFFVEPSLLPGIIRYWQRHPSLSYAFTGLFLGPGSQAPRIDETAYEALYELEIACEGAARLGTPQNRYLYDLLFRDLLMDRSGNPHRAEISVDKLHNPHAPNGKLGLIEFRAFESYPSAEVMNRIALFIRCVIALLAHQPYAKPFRRWHGELHDRFFLPSFIAEDLAGICADLQGVGLPFRAAWLNEALAFRFPEYGQLKLGKKPLVILRQALEGWPLLGEQSESATTSRSVDSSMDRLEARLADPALEEQGILLVNGIPVRFRPGPGFAAAGIRYKAFYLNPSLHPHVPVHSPLLLEWVDRETLTVQAAARWHNWNPHNVSYPGRPRDEAESADRRAQRWEDWPYTIGQQRFIPTIDFPPEGQYTLDLRRYPSQAR